MVRWRLLEVWVGEEIVKMVHVFGECNVSSKLKDIVSKFRKSVGAL
jgi:hypothetical protein